MTFYLSISASFCPTIPLQNDPQTKDYLYIWNIWNRNQHFSIVEDTTINRFVQLLPNNTISLGIIWQIITILRSPEKKVSTTVRSSTALLSSLLFILILTLTSTWSLCGLDVWMKVFTFLWLWLQWYHDLYNTQIFGIMKWNQGANY